MSRCDIHNHTRFSNIRLLDALPKPEQTIDRAIELGLAGVGITDHECLCAHPAAIQYMEKVKENNPDFKLLLGDEIYLVDERPSKEHYHFILIAKDKIGHKQLRILSSLAWVNSYETARMERVDTLKSDLEEIVKANPGHLIASTACIGGEIGKRVLAMNSALVVGDQATAKENHDKVTEFILWCKGLFGDDFYLEVQPGVSSEQIEVNKVIDRLSLAFGIKMIPTSDSHYLKKEDRYVHKAFLQSKEGEREVDAFYQDAYLHSDEEMIDKFGLSGFSKEYVENMFENSIELMNKVEQYSLFHTQQIPKVKVATYAKGLHQDILAPYPNLLKLSNSDDTIHRYWINYCVDKLIELDKCNKVYLDRLEEEANTKAIISEKLDTNIFAYPVTLQYYINMFWELGSTVGAGRGSSCSGLNHYLLGVTQLDPIQWNLPFWRYLNPDRIELPDIDLDLASSKRPGILKEIKKERGAAFNESIPQVFKDNLGCTLVATFGTESSKSAVATACRGYRSEEYPDGIDVDVAQYLSSLIPTERGFVWDLKTVTKGDPDKDRKPVTTFINEVSKYPGLLDIMLGIEGCISRRGSHASGVIFNDEDPFEYACYMRTPSGDITTQYDLHQQEWCGATKYDFLVTEIQDKITQTIEFIQKYEHCDEELSLKEWYNKYLHPNILPIEEENVWNKIQNVEVLDLFQFDSQVGSQAAKKIKPSSLLELSDANGLMRLMPMADGTVPLDKYCTYKNNISLWFREMRDKYKLTEAEIDGVKPHFARSYGVPPSQEQLMTMLMDENICSFTLKEANAARKIVAKKQLSKIPELHEKVLTQAKSENLGKYIWECGIGPQMSYSFSIIHALAYSFIAYQAAYLATRWNPIYWDTACLIVNSSSLEDNDDEKRQKSADYDKIAKAIANIMKNGIKVSLVDINKSGYTFAPDAEKQQILYGLKPISRLNDEMIAKIISLRPFKSIADFMCRCPLPKVVMVNLIKAGAFDSLDTEFANRKEIMCYYLMQVGELKKRLTLQNMPGLINYGIIPEELKLQKNVYEFNKYLKKKNYVLDNSCINFINQCLVEDADMLLENSETINAKTWDNVYQKHMNIVRQWILENKDEILNNLNYAIFKQIWDKYASGTLAKWEMDSVCFYSHPHELANVNFKKYGIVDFNSLKSNDVDYYFNRGKAQIPIFKLHRIAGTVIGKDDTKRLISLLTTTGVVTVKFTRDYYGMFKKQISNLDPTTGKKTVIEKSWFGRGNKLIVQGYRREDTFVAKNYSKTESHQLYKITNVIGDSITLVHERASGLAEDEEEYGNE